MLASLLIGLMLGGGIFLPDAWYDACDEYGVMVYHDMAVSTIAVNPCSAQASESLLACPQYAQHGHSPDSTATQDAELRHQIRRLSHHPSIVIYDGCNECRVVIGTPTGMLLERHPSACF